MKYKWKPNASQKKEYIEKLKEKETLNLIKTENPIRTNDEIEYYSMNKGEIIKGTIIKHSYGNVKNQHTFTIQKEDGSIILVKGRNLYPNLKNHSYKYEN